jgi:hypothetical protein
VIEVKAPLEIKPDPQGGLELMFWVCDSFNYTTPFRAMLVEIAEVLGRDPSVDLSLPPYFAGEDFVEGALTLQEGPLRVYYEYALSYLSLGNDDWKVLKVVAERLQPHVALI